MKAAALALIAALAASPVPVIAADLDGRRPPLPSPSDLYVGCYLFVHKTDVPVDAESHAEMFSGARCGLTSILAITYREGANDHQRLKFCLPKTTDVRIDPARAMAIAYLEWFELYGSRIPNDHDGNAAFVTAMIMKWPCSGRVP
jgi:hypothetical protein